MSKISIERGAYVAEAHVYYDEQDPTNRGWYGEYVVRTRGYDGRVVAQDDSVKVWSEEMPRRRDASTAAARVARRALRHMLRHAIEAR